MTVDGVKCDALLDSGNLYRNVISTSFLHKLGFSTDSLVPVPGATDVGSAKHGASLKVLGQLPRKVALRFAGLARTVAVRPVVLDNLSMDFNIAGPFMKTAGIDQLHSRDCVSIQGTIIKLKSSPSAPSPQKISSSPVYLVNDVTVPPMASAPVSLRSPRLEDGSMAAQDGFLRGADKLEAVYDIHAFKDVALTPDPDGRLVAGLFNSTGDPIFVPAGTRYGDFTLLCSTEDASLFPDRIAVLSAPPKVDRPEELPAFLHGPTTRRNYEQRAAHVISTFNIDDNPVLSSPADKATLVGLILKYWSVFSFDGGFGCTDLIQHDIVTTNTRPVNQRYRPVNPSLEPCLKAQLDLWLQQGVIEEAQSPWNFALVAAPKKNGKIRWCVDYRRLNDVTVRDSHQIGNVEDNLSRLSRSTVFSALDGAGAFNQIPLAEDARTKTAFSTPFGQYQFRRLPFGLCNGPATYARLSSWSCTACRPVSLSPTWTMLSSTPELSPSTSRTLRGSSSPTRLRA